MQTIFCYNSGAVDSIKEAEKLLNQSVTESHKLYFLYLELIHEIVKFAEHKIEIAKNKKIPTKADLEPNMRFVRNRAIEQIRTSDEFREYQKKYALSLTDKPELIKKIYMDLVVSDVYKEYMSAEEDSYESDKKFLAKFYAKFLPYCEDVYAVFEEMSVFWNDESEFVMSMLAKTVKKFNSSEGIYIRFLDKYSSYEDEHFAIKLLNDSLLNKVEYQETIKEFSKNWDVERIARLDMVIMQMAISEIKQFDNIPLQISLNEYIEIAKFYSTAKSSNFINGMLDRMKTSMDLSNKSEFFEKN
jgi:N utilization substance protein B